MSETETIDRLFLELSQVSKATTARELALTAEHDRLAGELERLTKALAQSGNYFADHDTYPQRVEFANGRVVQLVSSGSTHYLAVNRTNPAGRTVDTDAAESRPCPAITDEVVEELAREAGKAMHEVRQDILPTGRQCAAATRAVLDRAASLGLMGGEGSGEKPKENPRERDDSAFDQALALVERLLGEHVLNDSEASVIRAGLMVAPSPPASGPVVLSEGEWLRVARALSDAIWRPFCSFLDNPSHRDECLAGAKAAVEKYLAILASRSTGTEVEA